jgi:hypothetical protein
MNKQAATGCIVLSVLVLLCVSSALLAVDRVCIDGLTGRMPIYPDAEVLWQRYTFLRPFGMGRTAMELHTDDAYRDVLGWYARATGFNARNYGNTIGFRVSRVEWDVSPDESGEGSIIYLVGTCAQ